MKKQLLLILAVFISVSSFTQVVTTDPIVPVVNMPVTVTFDATQGSAGLAGYTGDVYAHTGVITEYSTHSSDWKYVKTGWGENTPETKMTRIADDLYTLEILPTIRDYYGVPTNENILQMAFVFRSESEVGGNWLTGKTETGGDIFVDVIEAGLNLIFLQPEYTPALVALNDSIIVDVYANDATSVLLYIDDVLLTEVEGNTLQDTILVTDYETRWVKAVAKNNTFAVADSFYYVVRPEVEIAELPAGTKDGINYIDDETVILSLLAPGKEFVYVIGDFNNWGLENDYFMNMTPDGERFWLEIGGLTSGQEYIFQYFVDGKIKVGDPYADKTSDPWNDQYITEQTYPGLIEYPAGKTSGIATVLQTAQVPYVWQVENFIPVKTTDLVVYEMLVRDFTSEHSYEAVTDTLDYLAKLGINALELMPVNEFEGNSSWGYNPSFYFAPDKYYGPKNELKKLIDECHKRGIAVFIDMVLNHSYDQSPLVQLYFDGSNPTADNPWYNVQSNFTNPDAQWGNDFNHESIYTQNFMDSVNSYWMSEYRFDGFRFDFTKGFSNTPHTSSDPWGSNYDADRIAILKRMADEIWARNENALVILEHLAVNTEEKELANYGMLMWGNANYNYGEASMAYNESGKSDFSWISYQKRGWNDPHVVGYMESHDEERIMFKNYSWGNSSGDYDIRDTTAALDRIRLISTFFYTIPGPKMIWQFGELGYDYSIDYNGRLGEKPVRWDYYDDWRRKYNYDFISALIDLKTNNDVFETDDYTLDVYGVMKKIKLYSDNINVIIVGNFGVVADEIAPGFPHSGAWYEYFSGETLEVTDVSMDIPLDQGEYRIYTDVKLETPDIGTGIIAPAEGSLHNFAGSIFPNPVSETARLQLDLDKETKLGVSIYDLLGSEVSVVEERFYKSGKQTIDLDTQILKPGIYFCVIHSQQQRETIKIIKQ
jgi:1,4-alpha-glucan branching enzyme